MRIALLLILLLSGCAATSPAPAPLDCAAARTFHVVNHGLHTGVVVAADDLLRAVPDLGEDFPREGFIELGWGDEGFYQAEQPGVGQALRALFWPGGSVLHLARVPVEPASYFPAGQVATVSVDEDGYQRLLDFLADGFARAPGSEPRALGPGLYGHSHFYPATGRYSLFNTCNTWVAQALAASGFPVTSTSVVTAGGVMSQLRQRRCPP
ncbi:DUF2459 domain-containing protein [Zestomonas carbonaria]|uniref:DUF2459 domain-containing protein n=1 Tax=Zestomonas carbonaria TaxID=2762745 RepID=A0A7U7ESX7_9GAMM|nr:DUF2459 domain-containing protein [Pseudomonas carbonaria]CAD5110569.1 hypothetical protein PSEWESI4_04892 [Pseudomonas carbonaria]